MQVKRLLADATAGLAAAYAVGAGMFAAIAANVPVAVYFAVAVLLGAASVTLGVVVAHRRPDNVDERPDHAGRTHAGADHPGRAERAA
jgi:hypothetical protein